MPTSPGVAGRVALVVPTVGRPSLAALVGRLAGDRALAGAVVVVVDDRPLGGPALALGPTGRLDVRLRRSGGRGPAAARNTGWLAVDAPWIAFLDDDVLPTPGWGTALAADLDRADATGAAGSQGRIVVPVVAGRRPTDWERQTQGLSGARWATADMAYRRSVLVEVGGFDERFGGAYREDADLALRAGAHGPLEVGRRCVVHPVRPAPWWVSVSRQRGNADDHLVRRAHGRGWRAAAGAPRGRLRRHLVTTGALVLAAGGAVTGRRRLGVGAAVVAAAGVVDLAGARIRPGPRTPAEVAAMVATSIAIPPAAVAWSAVGLVRRPPARRRPAALLLDRDGTLVHDVPYNGDPALVRPVDGAGAALDRARAAGLRVGLVSNQSGVARGLIAPADVEACHRRLQELVGPLDVVRWCRHGPDDGCSCRKPAPGMVVSAAAELGVAEADVVVIGDIGADVEAAGRAGARAILVPTAATRPAEVAAAPAVAPDLATAVTLALHGLAGSPQALVEGGEDLGHGDLEEAGVGDGAVGVAGAAGPQDGVVARRRWAPAVG
ncbi:MAG TPA: HAD-IIIA family hydrolase [Iamia sp.]|nr:HAD-IIIA family hydrolase [Iamia sp.]